MNKHRGQRGQMSQTQCLPRLTGRTQDCRRGSARGRLTPAERPLLGTRAPPCSAPDVPERGPGHPLLDLGTGDLDVFASRKLRIGALAFMYTLMQSSKKCKHQVSATWEFEEVRMPSPPFGRTKRVKGWAPFSVSDGE